MIGEHKIYNNRILVRVDQIVEVIDNSPEE